MPDIDYTSYNAFICKAISNQYGTHDIKNYLKWKSLSSFKMKFLVANGILKFENVFFQPKQMARNAWASKLYLLSLGKYKVSSSLANK